MFTPSPLLQKLYKYKRGSINKDSLERREERERGSSQFCPSVFSSNVCVCENVWIFVRSTTCVCARDSKGRKYKREVELKCTREVGAEGEFVRSTSNLTEGHAADSGKVCQGVVG